MSAPSAPDETAPGRRIAVVTGASSGIGEATARLLAHKGWQCVLVARREDRLRALAEELGAGVELCDVADRDAVEAMAARILERHPAIHLLLNNAGMPARGSYLTVDLDLVRRVIEVNYLGGVWCTRALLPASARRCPARTSSTSSRSQERPPSPRPGHMRPRSTPSSPSPARSRRRSSARASPSTPCCPASSRPRASPRRTCSRAGSWAGS